MKLTAEISIIGKLTRVLRIVVRASIYTTQVICGNCRRGKPTRPGNIFRTRIQRTEIRVPCPRNRKRLYKSHTIVEAPILTFNPANHQLLCNRRLLYRTFKTRAITLLNTSTMFPRRGPPRFLSRPSLPVGLVQFLRERRDSDEFDRPHPH